LDDAQPAASESLDDAVVRDGFAGHAAKHAMAEDMRYTTAAQLLDNAVMRDGLADQSRARPI